MKYSIELMALTIGLVVAVGVGFSSLTPAVEGLMNGALLETAELTAKFVQP